jgi:hypothetical protein
MNKTPKERYSICENCENFNKTIKTCKICHCFMFVKTKFNDASCPKGKW